MGSRRTAQTASLHIAGRDSIERAHLLHFFNIGNTAHLGMYILVS